jgi:hypothetical protein
MFTSHWFSTGSPKFLIDLIRQEHLFDLSQMSVLSSVIESYEIETLNLKALLFQTGYLTIKKRDLRTSSFILDYPNYEVEIAMSYAILDLMTGRRVAKMDSPLFTLQDAFRANNAERVIKIINALMSDIPYQLLQSDKEAFFHALIHLIFRYIGVTIESEVCTSNGRLDAAVTTETHVYILEFKIDKTAAVAMQQIIDKGYKVKYELTNKQIVGLGININTETKKIDDWTMHVF